VQRVTVGNTLRSCTTLLCMNALAYQEDTPAVTTGESWTAYLRRITHGLPRKDIAAAANIDVSGVSRWLRGVSQPSPDKVITFARSLNKSPIEALIAAGYLNTVDTEGAVEVIQSLSLLSDDVLIDELRARLRGRLEPVELPGRRTPMPALGDKTKGRVRRPR
jgi:transcriptional regulator with XRE-family HTH domain